MCSPFLLIFLAFFYPFACSAGEGAVTPGGKADALLEAGRNMYMEGRLPNGEPMSARVQGDILLNGEQVSCGGCHRRSGMGSTEGQQVVPAVTGEILYSPLQIPTAKPPAPPVLRPAYTDATLRRAISGGVDANGEPLDANMPRYPLNDQEFAALKAYLNTLSIQIAPGVTEEEIHFATIVAGSVPKKSRKALLDVMQAYIKQKNTETRNESNRAKNAPWHKRWIFGNYRKWVLHIWELEGDPSTWPSQLQSHYQAQPVFAVLSGLAPGSWQPIHDFCESNQLPSLFPTTDLPVIADKDFYSVYFTRGMTLEGEVVASHLREEQMESGVLQIFRKGDPYSVTAAEAMRRQLHAQDTSLTDVALEAGEGPVQWEQIEGLSAAQTLVIWLPGKELEGFWRWLETNQAPQRVYLSSTQYGKDFAKVPESQRDRVLFVHPMEVPGKLTRLLIRSTGWLRSQRIYAPDQKRVQANAYFALKTAGGALQVIRGYFFRDYFLERIEHMMDNANYTSVYPRVSLAPNQRFVSKGAYIAQVARAPRAGLVPVTQWFTP